MAIFPLAHAPPVTALLKIVDELAHTFVAPAIAGGTGFTVTITMAEQPELTV
jgi:hypothetical protein